MLVNWSRSEEIVRISFEEDTVGFGIEEDIDFNIEEDISFGIVEVSRITKDVVTK